MRSWNGREPISGCQRAGGRTTSRRTTPGLDGTCRSCTEQARTWRGGWGGLGGRGAPPGGPAQACQHGRAGEGGGGGGTAARAAGGAAGSAAVRAAAAEVAARGARVQQTPPRLQARVTRLCRRRAGAWCPPSARLRSLTTSGWWVTGGSWMVGCCWGLGWYCWCLPAVPCKGECGSRAASARDGSMWRGGAVRGAGVGREDSQWSRSGRATKCGGGGRAGGGGAGEEGGRGCSSISWPCHPTAPPPPPHHLQVLVHRATGLPTLLPAAPLCAVQRSQRGRAGVSSLPASAGYPVRTGGRAGGGWWASRVAARECVVGIKSDFEVPTYPAYSAGHGQQQHTVMGGACLFRLVRPLDLPRGWWGGARCDSFAATPSIAVPSTAKGWHGRVQT